MVCHLGRLFHIVSGKISTLLLSLTDLEGIHPHMEFPSSIPPLRGYNPSVSQAPYQGSQFVYQEDLQAADSRIREIMSANSTDDIVLDPVSALLRAGEIVNRNSRDRPGS